MSIAELRNSTGPRLRTRTSGCTIREDRSDMLIFRQSTPSVTIAERRSGTGTSACSAVLTITGRASWM